MLIEQTLDKLHAMKLGAMAEAVQQQLRAGAAAPLSFEERLGLLVDTEWTAREQRVLASLCSRSILENTHPSAGRKTTLQS